MSTAERNRFLDHGSSDDSDVEDGYDSEAAEVSKGRSSKRRKLSHSDSEGSGSGSDSDGARVDKNEVPDSEDGDEQSGAAEEEEYDDAATTTSKSIPHMSPAVEHAPTGPKNKSKSKSKETKPGVIYLSSLPPYLKPSALKNLLTQRGFSPITRLFLTPASKAKSSSKKNSRQLYTEGWIEFASKKTARRCAESLNTQIVGGRKGGFYYDDIWNMKYLKGMGWDELMAGIREERREQEGRRDEERRVIAKETKRFMEGVEEGRRIEGIKRKRSGKGAKSENNGGEVDGGGNGDAVKRTWRQFEVKGKGKHGTVKRKEGISDDVQEVLGKIF